MDDLKGMTPIIILGAGRSGTKFFRDTLLASPQTCAIPYDINYIWRYSNESVGHDELTVDQVTRNSKEFIRTSIVKFAARQNSSANFLLEKTVSNGLRVEFIKAVFPEAKFIHLIRDGRAVVESSMRMWNQPPQTSYLLKKIKYFPWQNYRYALSYFGNLIKGLLGRARGQETWGPRYNGIMQDVDTLPLIDICAKQWQKCVVSAADQLDLLPHENVLTIKYEDFVSSSTPLRRTIDFIGLDNPEEIVSCYEKNLQASNAKTWEERINETDLHKLNLMLEKTLERFGYSPL